MIGVELDVMGVVGVPKGVSLSPLLKPKVGVAKGPVFFSCTTFYWQLIQFHFFSVSELHIEVEIFRSRI